MGNVLDNLIEVYVKKELEGITSEDTTPKKLEQYEKYLKDNLRESVTTEILEVHKPKMKENLLHELTKKELLKYKLEEWHYFIAATIVIATALSLAVNQLTSAIDVINKAIVVSAGVPSWLLPGVVIIICLAAVGIAVCLLFKEKKYTLDKEDK